MAASICLRQSRDCRRKMGKPNSTGTQKNRNTINVALGTQKARGQPSAQAIEKWEADLVAQT